MDGIVPIRKIFSIINSCISIDQLKTCEKIASFYTNILKKKGVVNHKTVLEILQIKIEEKRSELNLSNNFKGKIRRRKIKVKEIEAELVENFY